VGVDWVCGRVGGGLEGEVVGCDGRTR